MQKAATVFISYLGARLGSNSRPSANSVHSCSVRSHLILWLGFQLEPAQRARDCGREEPEDAHRRARLRGGQAAALAGSAGAGGRPQSRARGCAAPALPCPALFDEPAYSFPQRSLFEAQGGEEEEGGRRGGTRGDGRWDGAAEARTTAKSGCTGRSRGQCRRDAGGGAARSRCAYLSPLSISTHP